MSGRGTIVLLTILAIVAVYASDQIAPATSDRQAQLRIWLVARAGGIVTFLLLTFQVSVGLVLSHPTNKSTWKLSKRIFPWHDHIWVFVLAFLLVHIVSIVLDPYAKVTLLGALIPGLSEYRSVPVAIGTHGALRVPRHGPHGPLHEAPAGWDLAQFHRPLSLVWVLAWLHGVLAGTDSDALGALYVATGLAVVVSGSYRYWASRQRRPTFTTSLPEVTR